MLLRREVWRKVGGFPDLRAAEDLMFMEGIERGGFRVAWAPRATVWWQLRPTLASTFRVRAPRASPNRERAPDDPAGRQPPRA